MTHRYTCYRSLDRRHPLVFHGVLDTELLASGLKVVYKHPRPAVLKLLSGDRDFIPLIRNAYEENWETELWGFSSSISDELQQMVNRVFLLDDVFDEIGKYQQL